MNVKSVVENKEKYEVELTIEVGQEEFEAGLEKAYRKNRSSISVPGFRKGKAPRKVIEGLDKEPLKVDLARDKAMALVAAEGKPHLVAAEDDGDIKVTEVTKDDVQEESKEEANGEEAPAEEKPKKRTTRTKKTEEAAGEEAEKKPAARKPRAKKTTEEGEEAPKKTTTRKKKAEEPKGEE